VSAKSLRFSFAPFAALFENKWFFDALYEDFLVEHAGEPDVAPTPRTPLRMPSVRFARHADPGRGSDEHDAPPDVLARTDAALVSAWAASSHAAAGVRCNACHVVDDTWQDRPGVAGCRACHADEVRGFLESRHGMRVAAGLEPMRPDLARLPMKADAHGDLGCASCHGAHAFDPRAAVVEACAGCHADEHSLAYFGSPHHALQVREEAGDAPPGSGVSCATCHLPRVERGGETVVWHNQNATLRPNEKMIRAACLDCHGLGFSLDALADAALVRRNFRGAPDRHVESVDWAVARVAPPRDPGEANPTTKTREDRP